MFAEGRVGLLIGGDLVDTVGYWSRFWVMVWDAVVYQLHVYYGL